MSQLLDRIHARCERIDSGCFVWQGATNSKGYGQIRHEGRVVYVHRAVWSEIVGPIPAGMTIDHACEVHPCVEVAHLSLMTPAQNSLAWWLSNPERAARLTHCHKGHPKRRTPSGDNYCPTCHREWNLRTPSARARALSHSPE